MPELNLNQITEKLNAEFLGEQRKLIFWYDDNAEFAEDIDTLCLENAAVYHLQKDNQFMTKLFLEREDTENNYLLYAPFEKPPLIENHLADTLRYSDEFFADRASLICLDLHMDNACKAVVQKHIGFFANKERQQRFYNFEVEQYTPDLVEAALMSALCKVKVPSFEEVLRVVLSQDSLEDDKYLAEFEKYKLGKVFWRFCKVTFGYAEEEPSLAKLVYTMFVTYMAKTVPEPLVSALENYKSHKSGSIITFLDSLMNSVVYKESFDCLSKRVYRDLAIESALEKLDTSSVVNLDIFVDVDKKIISWMIERLLNEDLSATLHSYGLTEICELRRNMHFNVATATHYHILQNAIHIIENARFTPKQDLQALCKEYMDKDFQVDQKYRFFYYYYDKLENNALYEQLVALVENIYTNRFLNPLAVAFTSELAKAGGETGLIQQTDFYRKFIKTSKERVVVIISDGLRFEVGQSLLKRLLADEKCEAKMHGLQSVLPSYTRFGMSALLPHKTLEMNEDCEVLVDGKVCSDIKAREHILQQHNPNSRAVKFDELKTTREAREVTTGQEVVYLYHDQIDARGDKLPTENEVFTACEEAVDEIYTMIKRLTSANNTKFLITADHGFLYKREKLTASDKISGIKNGFMGKRYIVAQEKLSAEGVFGIPLSSVLHNEDKRMVSLPMGCDIFSTPGGGQNYVHGGASLQEMLVPVVEVKTSKSYTETKNVTISLVSILTKITNLSVNVDLIQNEPVTDVNKQTSYQLYFVADDNEKISNDNLYVASKKEKDAGKRMFRLKFTFKNQHYEANRKYYLVAVDEKSSLEIIRHEVKMDLAFVDDYGF